MRTEETKVYNFSELSEDAKETAIEQFQDQEYHWSSEALESLKKFLEYFDCKLGRYSIDFLEPARSLVKFDCPNEEDEELRERINDLVKDGQSVAIDHLTGYCADDDLALGFWEEYKQGGTAEECIKNAISNWLYSCQKDYEWQISEAGIEDFTEVNGIEFTADGKIFG